MADYNDLEVFLMKLSFSTLPCEDWSVDQLIACCQANGFTGIELKEDSQYALSLSTSREELLLAAEKFRSAGITVTNIGTRAIFNGVKEGEAEALEELKRCIDMAQTLSARGVRIMLGTYLRYNNAGVQPLDTDKVVGYIREACDYAAPRNVEVWIETHNEFSTGQVLRELLEQINRPNCKIIYDIIHPYEFGEEPEETVRLFGKECAHVHMKDAVPFDDQTIHEWKYTQFGEGKLPLQQIIAALEASGYDGFYSLEWEPKWRPELRELNLDTAEVLAAYSQLMPRFDNKQ
jgi:3-dehydroshikimate dehydratase